MPTSAKISDFSGGDYAHLRDLIESMPIGVLMFDLKGRIMANPVFRKIAHYPEIKHDLKGFLKYFLGENQELENSINLPYLVDKVLKTARPVNCEEVHFDNSIYEMVISPVRDRNSKVIGGAIILHDITHMKEIDEIKTNFVSVASHQLRTPLTAMKLFIEMLLSREVGELNGEQAEYLTNIKESMDHLINLVNTFLNISRIEDNRLKIETESTNLEELIVNIIAEVGPLAELKHCRLVFNKPRKKIPKISVDRLLFRQVVHNLLTNAIRYSQPAGGRITVSLSDDGIPEKTDPASYLWRKGGILIKVADNGLGIPREAQGKIFQKFFRADNAVKVLTDGSGLGLYLVKTIVDASGCDIKFKSRVGQGTTFYFLIPKAGMIEKEGKTVLAA